MGAIGSGIPYYLLINLGTGILLAVTIIYEYFDDYSKDKKKKMQSPVAGSS